MSRLGGGSSSSSTSSSSSSTRNLPPSPPSIFCIESQHRQTEYTIDLHAVTIRVSNSRQSLYYHFYDIRLHYHPPAF